MTIKPFLVTQVPKRGNRESHSIVVHVIQAISERDALKRVATDLFSPGDRYYKKPQAQALVQNHAYVL